MGEGSAQRARRLAPEHVGMRRFLLGTGIASDFINHRHRIRPGQLHGGLGRQRPESHPGAVGRRLGFRGGGTRGVTSRGHKNRPRGRPIRPTGQKRYDYRSGDRPGCRAGPDGEPGLVRRGPGSLAEERHEFPSGRGSIDPALPGLPLPVPVFRPPSHLVANLLSSQLESYFPHITRGISLNFRGCPECGQMS